MQLWHPWPQARPNYLWNYAPNEVIKSRKGAPKPKVISFCLAKPYHVKKWSLSDTSSPFLWFTDEDHDNNESTKLGILSRHAWILKHMHTMIPGHVMEFIGKKKMPINNAKLSFSLPFKTGLQLSSSSHRLENMIPQSTPPKKKWWLYTTKLLGTKQHLDVDVGFFPTPNLTSASMIKIYPLNSLTFQIIGKTAHLRKTNFGIVPTTKKTIEWARGIIPFAAHKMNEPFAKAKKKGRYKIAGHSRIQQHDMHLFATDRWDIFSSIFELFTEYYLLPRLKLLTLWAFVNSTSM